MDPVLALAALLAALVPGARREAAPTPADSPQGVAYRIEAALDEPGGVLRGRARLRYENRRADRLDTLYFHLYLNAFRPNSAWARRELTFGIRRFQDLGPDDHAYERVRAVTVDGRPARAVYPFAPDSTVLAVPLPRPLARGETLVAELDWEARLATVPRRQGRRGRHYDFAHGYPRIAVYEAPTPHAPARGAGGGGGWAFRPHLPQGEFYGEFASYDVTLDLPADLVVAATGVPVEGDPGWAAAAAPGTGPVYDRRDAYPPRPAEPLGFLSDAPAPGRKRVRWRAENVHHFAWSAAPDFVYEGGEWRGTALHVLRKPGDTAWAGGAALERMRRALDWLEDMLGPYPYPQATIVHRIEEGGTEFPMLVMNGSASEGLILHELAHLYLHGAVANNEWRDGWLDEGLVSFLTNWYWEERGRPDVWRQTMAAAIARERAGRTQPIATPAAEFADMDAYNAFTYTKPAVVFRMLRELVGPETLRRALRDYVERNRFRHVSEEALRAAVARASGQDLGWFFDQWIHTTATLDVAVGAADLIPQPGGGSVARVEVLRRGDAWMPIVVQIGAVRCTLRGREPRQVLEVEVASPSVEVVLDPDGVLLDLDPDNNRRTLQPPGARRPPSHVAGGDDRPATPAHESAGCGPTPPTPRRRQ